ncbi:putative LRR receptor-like serine/threonine-protein kinase [Cocos nucifera]|uniref:Putative LRR receptor-like serine/threonine-protein kinase n=1 Tax=Cocos nucifera TaxID=13894 RepID=A0A8K0IA74_COCNU|nr:putative LRR receptor-like serine/threonine-protein kinase [Cocos nucifera]
MGFISLDCSIAGGSSCTDDTASIPTSDDQFISAGTKHIIPMQYVTASAKKQLSLRSFPNGTRNCYTLKSTVVGNFISIDCGIPDGSSYTDDGTNMTYTSDAQFIDAGVNHNISADHMTTSLQRQQSSLRSFPNGPRNCYTLKPVKQGQKYLIRAIFLHGNYDGCCKSNANVSLQFDLHLGVNLWKQVNISNTSFVYRSEIMTVASADFILVCLINKGHGIPFISSLELRPLKGTLYPVVNSTCSLVLHARRNFGKKYGTILRYPDDQKDRIWIPFRNDPFWSDISTTNEVDHKEDDLFEVPRAVLQTAAVPVNSNELAFYWWAGCSEETRLTYHYFMHFAEIQDEHRTFNINLNGEFWYGPVTPPDRMSLTVYTASPGNLYWYNISLLATEYSIGPPSINAIEVYWVMLISANETNVQDVKAIMAIKEQYKMKRNWMGDPCAPSDYAWDGLHCSSSTNSDKPRIISLNLSSSGLTGDIIQDFAELKVIENFKTRGFGGFSMLYKDRTLKHETGKPSNIGVLSWRKRLQIALESAQGLEYLHTGCRPTIIHRDVKSSNILLNHNLEAKIADFGLSKAFQSDVLSHISTVAGTPGYLDPEYYQTYQINEKSDVYGFGVVLLELITGQPPLLPTPGEGHIVQRVRAKVARGNIDDIVDARLQGEYDVNSVWKAVNIALMCTALSSVQRATMDDVVMQLKESLALQIAWNQHHYTEAVETSLNSAFEMVDVGKAQHLARHRNLVSFVGYCKDGDYLALVYEFVTRNPARAS